ncbi:hypothetical protein OK348_13420 [Flavobacterium sp. MXW15]|uniref:Polymer-forming cytoskeletal protein n=1 Tax=Xanthomonas chitinilytica TaxID=2989819 RepID=A0ABT3JXS1_9XANT|nr:hypothetical protein [Xanthomonas sp. H13-6]MCW4455784.1 hypothetical protein [Flavobacterium sp. MXW15]MCW4473000.1 hypothetical protein [Xanthomonas sp. H13-6]
MQIDPTRIPSDGWTANGLPDFPCSPNPQLDDLVELGRNVAHIDEVIAFLEGGFCSTLFAFGQVLRERLPTIEARLAADNIATLHQGSTDAIVFNGDLTIDGDVLQPSLLLVTGNLTVNGALRDTGRIAVLGDLRCRHVGTDAWVIVGGDCIADGFVHGSYNHNMFEVLGQLRARAVLTDDHGFHAAGGIVATHAPSTPSRNGWGPSLFDLWDAGHRAELLAVAGTEVYAVVDREKFEEES